MRLVLRAMGAGSPRLRGVGAADFRRDLAGIGRERVAGDGAPDASMKTKNLCVRLQEAWIGHKYKKIFEHKTPTNRSLYYRPHG